MASSMTEYLTEEISNGSDPLMVRAILDSLPSDNDQQTMLYETLCTFAFDMRPASRKAVMLRLSLAECNLATLVRLFHFLFIKLCASHHPSRSAQHIQPFFFCAHASLWKLLNKSLNETDDTATNARLLTSAELARYSERARAVAQEEWKQLMFEARSEISRLINPEIAAAATNGKYVPVRHLPRVPLFSGGVSNETHADDLNMFMIPRSASSRPAVTSDTMYVEVPNGEIRRLPVQKGDATGSFVRRT